MTFLSLSPCILISLVEKEQGFKTSTDELKSAHTDSTMYENDFWQAVCTSLMKLYKTT